MSITRKNIEVIIENRKEYLENFPQFRDLLGYDDSTSVADSIIDADIESDDFEIGYEQGILRGLAMLSKECNK